VSTENYNGCKGFSSYVTLYAISTTVVNVTNDYVPSAPINFDNCFEHLKTVPFENLSLHTPSVDDLRIASVKIDEVQQLIKEQELKHDQKLYDMISRWSVLGAMSLFSMLILCSCCCSKCCRNCMFWVCDRWNPMDCWQQTRGRCCVSITNYSFPEVSSKTR
jgi:hypothetical protein